MIVCTCLGAEWKVPNEKGGKKKPTFWHPTWGLNFQVVLKKAESNNKSNNKNTVMAPRRHSALQQSI